MRILDIANGSWPSSVISKLLSSWIKKKFNIDQKISIDDLAVTIDDVNVHIRLTSNISIPKNEVSNLVDKVKGS